MRPCLGLLLLTCAAAGAEDLNTLLESKVNPDDYAIKQDEFGLRAPNPIQNLEARFRPDGVAIAPHKKDDALKTGALVRLRTASWGRADHMRTLEDTPPIALGVAQPPSAVQGPSSTAEGGCATCRVEYPHPGLTEWYLNGASGLEQGFTIADRPSGTGELRVHVKVSAARVSLHGDRVRLASDAGRALSFGKLVVKDVAGHELRAHLEVPNQATLALVVDDRAALYPIVIDPVVADAHWSEFTTGLNGPVYALAMDGSGNVYAGGQFTTAGGANANCVARWTPGTPSGSWSALGTGLGRTDAYTPSVSALAVDSSGNVYAGGFFTTAGGLSASYIAKWTPAASSWSALGMGMNSTVYALALDGSGNLYAGGRSSRPAGSVPITSPSGTVRTGPR